MVERWFDLAEILLETFERLGKRRSLGGDKVFTRLVVIMAVPLGEDRVIVDEVAGKSLLVNIHKIIMH